jgi:hypothetical protein
MSEIIFYTVGLWGVIMITCFISWMLDIMSNNNWQKRVTADDLRELKKLFENDGAFVGFNDKGEKFLVGYTRD